MARRVIVHIGPPKTGTTYIQRSLWDNRDALSEAGVLLPGSKRFDAFHVAQVVLEVEDIERRFPGHLDSFHRMMADVREWSGDAIISHEFLSGATRGQASALTAQLAPAQVLVVVTARDYVALLPALWQEAVKMAARRKLPEYIDSVLDGSKKGPWGLRSIDITSVVQQWSAAVGAANVHLATVPPSGSPPDLLWKRFLEAGDLRSEGLIPLSEPANPSLGSLETELLRRVGAALPPHLQVKQRRHRWLRQFLAHEVLPAWSSPPPVPDPERARRLRAWSEDTVIELSKGDVAIVGDLADLTSAPLPLEAEPIRPRDVLSLSAAVIGDLLERYRLLAEENAHLRYLLAEREADEPPRRKRRRARMG